MSLPTLDQFAAMAARAGRGSAAAWNALTTAEQTTIKSYARFDLDYFAGGDGAGVIYAVSPSDPPPTAPPT